MVRLLFLNDVLDFGAHRGKTVAAVLHDNPSYIKWAFENTQRVNLSLEVSAALKAAMTKPSYMEKYPNGSSVVLSSRRKRKAYYRRTEPMSWNNPNRQPTDILDQGFRDWTIDG